MHAWYRWIDTWIHGYMNGWIEGLIDRHKSLLWIILMTIKYYYCHCCHYYIYIICYCKLTYILTYGTIYRDTILYMVRMYIYIYVYYDIILYIYVLLCNQPETPAALTFCCSVNLEHIIKAWCVRGSVETCRSGNVGDFISILLRQSHLLVVAADQTCRWMLDAL